MLLTRRELAVMATAGLLMPRAAAAQSNDPLYRAQMDLIFGVGDDFYGAIREITERGNPDMIPGLIKGLRFSQYSRGPIVAALSELSGEYGRETWFDWMLWQEDHPEIIPHPSFIDFTRDLYRRIDPNFVDFLLPEYTDPAQMRIRLEEITWGGVIKDGIPSLDNPALIGAAEAEYLKPDDLVFGVSINGDTRAYPLRIMGWHEMFNEVIGGVPLALAYCTLCGSGILYETQLPDRDKPLIFGSSGFLYRSNKLMFDRETNSLWNQFTGEPVVGPLANSGIQLGLRPVTIDTWQNWTERNPDTRVLDLNTGYTRDYGSGVVYNQYFNSPDLMFPTNLDQPEFQAKDYVFGMRTMGAAKAWPLEAFADRTIINDRIGRTPVVLVGDAQTRTVRAYERGEWEFAEGLITDDGTTWTLSEDQLDAPDGRSLRRMAGQISYWFAWSGYMGDVAELYDG